MILTTEMAHPRESIVEAVVALLIAAGTAAGARVSNTRIEPHKKGALPALSVYALNDSENADASSEMEQAYDIELEVAVWAIPDEVNALMAEVQTAMRADPYIGGLASDVGAPGTVIGLAQENGRSDPTVAVGVLTYPVTYHIALAAT